MQTSVPGIFAAGNVVHVYDLVDWVTEAGYVAGRSAARFVLTGEKPSGDQVRFQAGDNVRYVVPQVMDKESLAQAPQRLQMRVVRPMEQKVWVEVLNGDELVARKAERYVRPGEMVTLELPQSAYDTVRRAEALSVRVVRR